MDKETGDRKQRGRRRRRSDKDPRSRGQRGAGETNRQGEGDELTLSDVGRMGDGLRSDVQHSRHFLVVGRMDVLVDAVPGEFDLRGERGEPG